MLGSLDVTKVHEMSHFTKRIVPRREKYATIALESVVDYNLYFWHASFRFPGTMNDINTWEWFLKHESMLNGKHNKIDHEFTLDG